MQRERAAAVRAERLDERFDLEPRAAEHERGRRVLHVQHPVERGRFVGARHDVRHLAHARHLAGGGPLARDRHARRVLQVALRDRQDARRHRRREERRLPALRRRVEDCVEVLGEAHVQHFVRLVQHEHAQVGQLERPAPDVIERAPGRGDDDADAAFERPDLGRNRRAAVHGHHRNADALGVLVDGLRDLHRQLARGDEHEPAGVPPGLGVLKKRLQHRQGEGGRLAGAGGGLGQQVLARNAAAEWLRAEPVSPLRIRARPRPRRARRPARDRQTRVVRRRLSLNSTSCRSLVLHCACRMAVRASIFKRPSRRGRRPLMPFGRVLGAILSVHSSSVPLGRPERRVDSSFRLVGRIAQETL